MKLKSIVAVECKNLTEQDVFRLLEMDGTEYTNAQQFEGHLQDSIAELWLNKYLKEHKIEVRI